MRVVVWLPLGQVDAHLISCLLHQGYGLHQALGSRYVRLVKGLAQLSPPAREGAEKSIGHVSLPQFTSSYDVPNGCINSIIKDTGYHVKQPVSLVLAVYEFVSPVYGSQCFVIYTVSIRANPI